MISLEKECSFSIYSFLFLLFFTLSSFVFLSSFSLSVSSFQGKTLPSKEELRMGKRTKDNDVISDHFLDPCHEHNIFSKLLLFLIFSPLSFWFLSSFSSPFCHERFVSRFHFLMSLTLSLTSLSLTFLPLSRGLFLLLSLPLFLPLFPPLSLLLSLSKTQENTHTRRSQMMEDGLMCSFSL